MHRFAPGDSVVWRSVDRKERIVQTVWPWTVRDRRRRRDRLVHPGRHGGQMAYRRTRRSGGSLHRAVGRRSRRHNVETHQRRPVVPLRRSLLAPGSRSRPRHGIWRGDTSTSRTRGVAPRSGSIRGTSTSISSPDPTATTGSGRTRTNLRGSSSRVASTRHAPPRSAAMASGRSRPSARWDRSTNGKRGGRIRAGAFRPFPTGGASTTP